MQSKRFMVALPEKILRGVEEIARSRFSSRASVVRELVAAGLAERTKRAAA